MTGQQQVRRHDDRGQHVVEIVRDAAGKLADRLHLLALRHLGFQRLLLGCVHRVDDGRLLGRRHVCHAGLSRHRVDEDTQMLFLRARFQHGVERFDLGLAGARRCERLMEPFHRVAVQQRLEEDMALQRVRIGDGAEQVHERRVGPQDPAILVERCDRHRRGIEESG